MAPQEEPSPEITHSELLVIPPKSGEHAQTFIILHGRGSNAKAFGPELLLSETGLGKLPDLFPNAKFVFPTAAARGMKRFKNYPVQQWFDYWNLDKPDEHDAIQLEGLRESTLYIHGLLEDEVAAVGSQNVVLWGLSQGCAISLIASLLWSGEALGAVVGMCGWLPLMGRMKYNVYAARTVCKPAIDAAVECLRERLYLPSSGENVTSAPHTPIFLGHGSQDDKVPLRLARESEEFLRGIGIRARFAVYEGLGHWYSDTMMGHIVEFIACDARWPVDEP